MDYHETLVDFLSKAGQGSLKIEELKGSSSSRVFLCGGEIYKIGAKEKVLSDISAYEKFKGCLCKDTYKKFFPEFRMLFSGVDYCIWKLSMIGRKNFEDVLLGFKGGREEALLLGQLNCNVLKGIEIIFERTNIVEKHNVIKEAHLFFLEILDALRVNLKKAGAKDILASDKITSLGLREEEFIPEYIPSLSHKDLAVANIRIGENNGVSFIDPRLAVPQLESSKAIGNVAIDLAGYYVSILRKEGELRRRNPSISLSFLTIPIEREIERYQRRLIFSDKLKDLCLLAWYSIYLACRCEYCMAPSRIWLYEKMRDDAISLMERL